MTAQKSAQSTTLLCPYLKHSTNVNFPMVYAFTELSLCYKFQYFSLNTKLKIRSSIYSTNEAAMLNIPQYYQYSKDS